MTRKSRIWIGIVLAISLGLCGFAVVSLIASKSGAAQGQGLAGGAIVLGYGLLGAMGGIVSAILLAMYLPPKPLWIVFTVAGVVGAVLLARLVLLLTQSSAENAAHLQQAYDQMPKFRVELVNETTAAEVPFDQLIMDWGTRSYTFTTDGKTCSAELTGKQAVQMLTALRGVEGLLLNQPQPCAADYSLLAQRLKFVIPEALPPDTTVDLDITQGCLRQHPALDTPRAAALAIIRANLRQQEC